MPPIIEIRQLGKKYALAEVQPYLALRDLVSEKIRNIFTAKGKNRSEFWALQDINLKIEQGQRVGIIGRNGAGKSTLLKILSRITPPTTGEVKIYGRVASLLEVGTGFHPELTGRENIFLNGSILGLSKKDIERSLDEIIEFSGVQKFIGTPLKHYSSGMQLRLAFAVAAHLEPEILLIDEVLAVGDIEFQKKCIGKMEEVSRAEGRTIVFVSHNLSQLQQICNRLVLIEQGKIIADGNTQDIINEYQKMVFQSNPYKWENSNKDGDFVISGICIKSREGVIRDVIDAEEENELEVRIRATKKITNSLIAIRFTNEQNIPVYTTTNGDSELGFPVIEKGEYIFRIPVPFSMFVPGFYHLVIAWIVPNYEVLFQVKDDIRIQVENKTYAGNILLDGRKETFTKPIKWQLIDQAGA
jgi:lipopolysaccharide transport system ATP-binding protein